MEALRVLVPGLGFAAFAWIVMRFALAFDALERAPVTVASIAITIAVVLLAAGRALRLRLPDRVAIRELDHRGGAAGRWIAAWELGRNPDPFAQAAVADAAGSLARARALVPELFPVRWPAGSGRAACLVLLAPIAAAVLHGTTWRLSWPDRAEAEIAADPFDAEGERLATMAERLDLPSMAWAIREARRLLEPLPAPVPAPVSVAKGPAPVPTRGSTITDPEARAFFDQVLSGATTESVGKEIADRFTGEMAAAAFKQLEAEFKSRGVTSGSQYEMGSSPGGIGDVSLPKDAGGGMGGMGPAVDPKKMKSDYLPDKEDMGAELASALKESFDAYLREFAAQMLQGMEDALERELSGNGKGAGGGAGALRGLPNSPRGMAEPRDSHAASPSRGGPALHSSRIRAPGGDSPQSPLRTGGKPSAARTGGQQAMGGTAAGGSGAGAGGEDASLTDGGAGSGAATGERFDLTGTLDERLAVVEVIRRMSGGSETVEESAASTLVRKTTKAAEARAAVSEDVPEEYRGAVEAYFRALGGDQGERK